MHIELDMKYVVEYYGGRFNITRPADVSGQMHINGNIVLNIHAPNYAATVAVYDAQSSPNNPILSRYLLTFRCRSIYGV